MDNWPHELAYITNVLTDGAHKIEMPEREPYTNQHLIDLLKNVDKKLLLKVMEIYKDDYEMFGYPYPDPLLMQVIKDQ